MVLFLAGFGFIHFFDFGYLLVHFQPLNPESLSCLSPLSLLFVFPVFIDSFCVSPSSGRHWIGDGGFLGLESNNKFSISILYQQAATSLRELFPGELFPVSDQVARFSVACFLDSQLFLSVLLKSVDKYSK